MRWLIRVKYIQHRFLFSPTLLAIIVMMGSTIVQATSIMAQEIKKVRLIGLAGDISAMDVRNHVILINLAEKLFDAKNDASPK